MNKIAPDDLARSAFVYVRQSTPDQLINNPESRRRQYALAPAPRHLAGKTWWSSMMILVAREAVRRGPALSACWPRSAQARPASCLRSKLHAWRVMVVIGTPSWSSAP